MRLEIDEQVSLELTKMKINLINKKHFWTNISYGFKALDYKFIA